MLKGSEVLSRLDPDVLQKLEDKQIRYEQYMPESTSRDDYITWREAFMTENRQVEYALENRNAVLETV